MKGFIHVYTGDGKGKTTAALGLAVRAMGTGIHVFIGQFMKSGEFGEVIALRRFEDMVTLRQYGSGVFVRGNPTQEDIDRANTGLIECEQALVSGTFGLVIFDEMVTAVSTGVLTESQVTGLIDRCPSGVEVVLTGRGASSALVERADLVTDMRNVKHYYEQGLDARKGIEH